MLFKGAKRTHLCIIRQTGAIRTTAQEILRDNIGRETHGQSNSTASPFWRKQNSLDLLVLFLFGGEGIFVFLPHKDYFKRLLKVGPYLRILN
jgi:hypothetical protein